MSKVIKIADLENEFEAGLLEQYLTDEGITFRIQSNFDSAYGNLFELIEGSWGRVFGFAEDKERILSILDDIRNSQPLFPDNEQPQDDF